jgi:hypothetical protein
MVRPVSLFVVGFVTLRAGVAFADRVVLHPGDSITVDGTQYSCGVTDADGVKLAIGDAITVNGHRIKCRSADADAPPPPPPPPPATIAVESHVETSCINDLYQVIDGKPAIGDAIHWADACRGFEIGKQCSATTASPDDDCFNALYQVIPGNFSDKDAIRARSSCRRLQATCPAPPNAVESSVDLGCLDQVYQATSGKPDGHTMLGWLEQCRDHAVGQCVIVGGTLQAGCVQKAYGMISGKFTSAEAATAARMCRTLELRCP